MQDHPTTTLPAIESHPDWCIGGSHDPLIPFEYDGDDDREHYALVASGVGWAVEIEQPVADLGPAYIFVRVGDSRWAVQASPGRSLAAAVARAADLIETDGGAR